LLAKQTRRPAPSVFSSLLATTQSMTWNGVSTRFPWREPLITTSTSGAKKKFFVELIKPSHYDDDGYVIQWIKSWIPSNSLACLYGLARDAAQRQVLGEDVEIVLNAYDECNTVIPVKDIIRRMKAGSGLVCMVGVQTNQFPRAVDMARQFRAAGLPVIIGGFHVSGCLAMLPDMPADLQEALDLGVSLFAGEGEGRFEQLLQETYRGELAPIYNFVNQLPDLQGAVTPFLPEAMVRRYVGSFASFDGGRGCPFQCSFCTIINVQGRKSRFRTADDVEDLIRTGLTQGINRYFITDDNFARNRNWESILDRLIELRSELDGDLGFMLQVDMLSHKIKGFVEKAVRAGVSKVFIGLESVNPDNLVSAKKRQNRLHEYQAMLRAWRGAGIITYAGYILGFPGDTPESIARDIDFIQRELPLDLLEFFQLTPLPGSEDHKKLYMQGVPMDPDMNKYDLEHVTMEHSQMTQQQWEDIYRQAWDLYYSPEHVETLLRRAAVMNDNPMKQTWRLTYHVAQFYGTMVYEKVHPLQGGYFRRKLRTQRRHGLPIENPLLFYPRRLWEIIKTYGPLPYFFWKLWRMRRRVLSDPNMRNYTDHALHPVASEEDDAGAAESKIAKARPQPQERAA
jgi:radical SAM superfamily enzyme YgiQ (UPF0313 family)